MSDPAGTTAPPRRLTRSTSDRMIAGVCGGLGEYTGLDPVIFRVALAVATILGGAGLIAYGVAWLVIPKADEEASHASTVLRDRDMSRTVLIVLAALAVLVVAGTFDGPFHHRWGGSGLTLVVLVGLGVWLWTRGDRVPAPPVPPAAPVASPQTAASTTPPSASTSPSPQPGPAPAPAKRSSKLFALTMSAVLIGVGVMAAIDLSGAADVDAGEALAMSLVIVGAGLLAGSVYGRSRGLIVVGLVLALAAAVTSVAPIPLRGGAGERNWRPVTLAELRGEYRLTAGEAVLDLRSLDLHGRTRHVDVVVGMGELRVWVPDGPEVVVDAHAGMGEVVVLDEEEESGVSVSRTVRRPGTRPGRLVLDLDVGMGRVEVDA